MDAPETLKKLGKIYARQDYGTGWAVRLIIQRNSARPGHSLQQCPPWSAYLEESLGIKEGLDE